jgi:hypothetical protein
VRNEKLRQRARWGAWLTQDATLRFPRPARGFCGDEAANGEQTTGSRERFFDWSGGGELQKPKNPGLKILLPHVKPLKSVFLMF